MRGKAIWQIGTKDHTTVDLGKELGISNVLAKILSSRGIRDIPTAKAFLYAQADNLDNPFNIPNMRRGAERIFTAINNKEKILVYGDYDVDGITATALLYSIVRRLGGNAGYYVPERLEEGYGLNRQAIANAKQQGTNVVITVDCGISAVEETKYAAELGLDLIITDHHQPPAVLPQAYAIINPKLASPSVPWFNLAGVGVAYKFALALAELFNSKAYCKEYLDLVALGTVADIVPLQDENRILVKEGLHLLKETLRPGIRALLDTSGIKGNEISSEQIGYILAPRLNASGRLGKADRAVEMLISADYETAKDTALILEQENKTRQEIEAGILEQALQMIEEQADLTKDKVIVLASQDWHPGVIGIVASRITDRYYRPTIIISVGQGIGKGSGRSIPGFNLYEALKQNREILQNYGGHEMAAGLMIEETQIQALRKALNLYAKENLLEKDLVPVLQADCEIAWNELSADLVEEIALMSPFGYHNPCPLLVLRGKRIANCKGVGANGNHLKMRVLDESGWLDGIAFNKGLHQEAINTCDRCDLAIVPEINRYKGQAKLQLVVKDLKPSCELDDPFQPVSFLDRLYQEGEIWLEDDYYRDIPNKEEFFTKVVGVTFSGRQEIIARIQDGDSAEIVREPENEYDFYAVAVYWQNNQIGYLNTRLARVIAPVIDTGAKYGAYVTQVTGKAHESLGVNLCIQKKGQEPDPKTQENLRAVLRELSVPEIEELIRAAVLGEYDYHQKQKEALESLKKGHNSLVIFATGRGKSAVFQSMGAYLALCNEKVTIIVYPLRSLVNDQLQRLRQSMASLGLNVEAINGSMNIEEKKEFFLRLIQRKIDIVLTTPEFLAFHSEKFQSISSRIGLFVVDEAHHLARAKRRGYRQLKRCWENLGRPLALAVTATADDEAAQKIADSLACEQLIIEEHVRGNLQVIDKRGETDKLAYLIKLISGGERIVVYVNSRKQAFQLASDLRLYYPPVRDEIAFYHGGLHSQYRKTLEEMFRSRALRVIVTTSAFGEGIDIPDIKHVVLYHLSFSRTEFNQLAGRAGRNNQEAYIHILFGEKDKSLNELILEGAAPTREVLGKVYLFLRDHFKNTDPLAITNAEIREAMQNEGIKNFREQTASACLSILEEMGLILREVEGSRRLIHFVPPPPGKLDLTDSVRYLEGLDELDEFEEFSADVLYEKPDDILMKINTPIYPRRTLRLYASISGDIKQP